MQETVAERQAKRSPEFGRLDIRNISKSFKSRPVVKSISLHVDAGEIIGLLGPNGAGKTTCFNLIIGLEACERGAIMLDGTNISKLPMYARARLGIGYLPQEPSVFRRLSVEDNVKAVLETRKEMTRTQQKQILNDLLEEFQITHLRKQLARTLSGGERRRVEIARAIALRPRFMLLDEPFAGVDPIAVEDVVTMIRWMSRRNVGILITDHNVRETLKICTRAHILSHGEVIVSGAADKILSNPVAKKFYLGENFRI
jgi:lipopolysaccharide export system ATP-binding protein